MCVCVCVWGGIFKRRVKKKYYYIRGGGHYMKNKNIDGRICFFFNLT